MNFFGALAWTRAAHAENVRHVTAAATHALSCLFSATACKLTSGQLLMGLVEAVSICDCHDAVFPYSQLQQFYKVCSSSCSCHCQILLVWCSCCVMSSNKSRSARRATACTYGEMSVTKVIAQALLQPKHVENCSGNTCILRSSMISHVMAYVQIIKMKHITCRLNKSQTFS